MSFLQVLRRSPATWRHTCLRYSSTSAPAADGATASGSSKKPAAPAAAATPLSSCPADTVLPGVNYLKGQGPVLAKPDEEYPEWLWTILKPKVYTDDGPGGKAERAQRRLENRQKIKDRNFMLTQ
ncbi:mitochondrial ribosomal protein L37-domain-containing protein [Crucibulum laeve]|uniref:Large ribosomal subunit protein mL54 n=1 Tax=Crucibulum laeve TaxID=68775 RepID=A0A5C3MFQ5_9AGAR|nr:mitochondrial ribosomal protein L37-domain-containing protein [Crucibulum laeve]